MKPVLFCITECELQKDDSIRSVIDMLTAYDYAINLSSFWLKKNSAFYVDDILTLGALVKPGLNYKGFRTTPVTFANLNPAIHHELVENSMNNLISAQDILTPEEFYKEFELIHPFEDGNGRVGAILYNILNKSIDDPILPPDIFKEDK